MVNCKFPDCGESGIKSYGYICKNHLKQCSKKGLDIELKKKEEDKRIKEFKNYYGITIKKGPVDENEELHGKQCIVYNDSNPRKSPYPIKWSGPMEHGKKHGRDTDGQEWDKDEWVYSHKGGYIGPIKNNKKEGEGEEQDGYLKYIGHFKDGLKCGKGILWKKIWPRRLHDSRAEEVIIFEGEWDNDKKSEGTEYVYESYVDDDGGGRALYAHRIIYNGVYDENGKYIKGTLYYTPIVLENLCYLSRNTNFISDNTCDKFKHFKGTFKNGELFMGKKYWINDEGNNVYQKYTLINGKQKEGFIHYKEDKTCSVCLGEEGEIDTLTCCGHSFHKQCIEPWIERKPECPKCRRRNPERFHIDELKYLV